MRKQVESSESEMSEDENQFKITANPHNDKIKVDAKYNQSSQSDISSLSEEDEEESEKRYQNAVRNGKQTIQHRNQSDSDDESDQSSGIDHIEQRIRRLQNDLEDKIDRQKSNQNVRREQIHQNENKEQIKVASKSYVNPPLPSKKKTSSNEGGLRSLNSSQNKNNINIVDNKSEHYLKQTIKSSKRQESKHQQKPSKNSPKKQIIKKNMEQRVVQINQVERNRQNSKNSGVEPSNSLLKQAHQQISQMHKVIEQLRKENVELRQQLAKKQKKQQKQQIQVLKMGAASQNLKLEKEIETLAALQSLMKKLKKSIVKKQKSNRLRNSSAAQLVVRKF